MDASSCACLKRWPRTKNEDQTILNVSDRRCEEQEMVYDMTRGISLHHQGLSILRSKLINTVDDVAISVGGGMKNLYASPVKLSIRQDPTPTTMFKTPPCLEAGTSISSLYAGPFHILQTSISWSVVEVVISLFTRSWSSGAFPNQPTTRTERRTREKGHSRR